MTKKLRIDIDLPSNFDTEKFELGFVIDLYFGAIKSKLVRHKRELATTGDRALQLLQASIVEE
jgi:hypothetical protein